MGAGLSDDLEWPQELLREFLRRTGGADVLRADVGLVADVEVRCGKSVPIRLNLVLGLCFGDPLSECGVEFFKVLAAAGLGRSQWPMSSSKKS